MECLSEETILNYVHGRLKSAQVARVDEHADACGSCDELLALAVSSATSPLPPDAAEALTPGTRVGRYMVIERIGIGGMSEIYSAHDPDLDRKVALKLLRPRTGDIARPSTDEWRVMREARAIAQLRHPHVVTVFDIGRFGNRAFIAMELVEGQTLTSWLAERRRTWREVLPVFVDAARGLAAAHNAGIIHRDFKPNNVMLGADGVVRVMDFGLAKRVDGTIASMARAAGPAPAQIAPTSDTFTSNGVIIGTRPFMSPEQLRGDGADARSDQYSFCVALFTALYGRRPFIDAGAGQPPVLKAPRGRVPRSLARAVARGLSVEPRDRWPGMNDLLRELSRPRGRPVRAWATATAVAVAAAIAAIGVSTHRRLKEPFRRESSAGLVSSIAPSPTSKPPNDLAARVARVQQRMEEADYLLETGRPQQSIELARSLLEEARRLGDRLLIAEMSLRLGRLKVATSLEPGAAVELREVLHLGLASQTEDLAAEAERLGPSQARLRSLFLYDRGLEKMETGDNQEAERLLQESLALKKRVLAEDDPDIARTVTTYAENLHRMGRDAEALELSTAAAARLAAHYGRRSLSFSACRNNQGEYLVALGRPAEAIPAFEDAFPAVEQTYGVDSDLIGFPLTGLGHALLMLGKPREAQRHLEKARRLREHGAAPALQAETDFYLAQALWAQRDAVHAVKLAASARTLYASQPRYRKDLQEVDDWIARHRR
jgi:serine/threonine protein kinase